MFTLLCQLLNKDSTALCTFQEWVDKATRLWLWNNNNILWILPTLCTSKKYTHTLSTEGFWNSREKWDLRGKKNNNSFYGRKVEAPGWYLKKFLHDGSVDIFYEAHYMYVKLVLQTSLWLTKLLSVNSFIAFYQKIPGKSKWKWFPE